MNIYIEREIHMWTFLNFIETLFVDVPNWYVMSPLNTLQRRRIILFSCGGLEKHFVILKAEAKIDDDSKTTACLFLFLPHEILFSPGSAAQVCSKSILNTAPRVIIIVAVVVFK